MCLGQVASQISTYFSMSSFSFASSHHLQSQVQNLYPFLLPSSNWSSSPLSFGFVMKTHSGKANLAKGFIKLN